METISLKQKSLEELLTMLPVEITWNNQQCMFALIKYAKSYACHAWETDEGHLVPIKEGGTEMLEFHSDDPKSAVAMMIGFLKQNKIIGLDFTADQFPEDLDTFYDDVVAELFTGKYSDGTKRIVLAKIEADESISDRIKRLHPKYWVETWAEVQKFTLIRDLGWA